MVKIGDMIFVGGIKLEIGLAGIKSDLGGGGHNFFSWVGVGNIKIYLGVGGGHFFFWVGGHKIWPWGGGRFW